MREDAEALARCQGDRPAPTEAEASRLARIALDQDLLCTLGFVSGIINSGVSVDSVLLQLVAPAARLIREKWAAEECSFEDVAAALHVLQQVVGTLVQQDPTTGRGHDP
jgi:hypothetical protein